MIQDVGKLNLWHTDPKEGMCFIDRGRCEAMSAMTQTWRNETFVCISELHWTVEKLKIREKYETWMEHGTRHSSGLSDARRRTYEITWATHRVATLLSSFLHLGLVWRAQMTWPTDSGMTKQYQSISYITTSQLQVWKEFPLRRLKLITWRYHSTSTRPDIVVASLLPQLVGESLFRPCLNKL